MAVYTFLVRNPKTGDPEEVARFDAQANAWQGEMLAEMQGLVKSLDGLQSFTELPSRIAGPKLWVVEEKAGSRDKFTWEEGDIEVLYEPKE